MSRRARSLREASAALGLAALLLAPLPAAAAPVLRQPDSEVSPTATPEPDPRSATPTETPTTPTTDPTETSTASLTPEDPPSSPTPSALPTSTVEDPSPTAIATSTATPTETASGSSTPSPSPEPPTPYAPRAVLINEIAWAGTLASPNDEWIELHNPGSEPVDLTGWRLTDGGDVNVALVGSIPAFGYSLLERTDETTVSDLAADRIYTGSLRNTGERLELLGPGSEIVDTANSGGGNWPAGQVDSRASMERRGRDDLAGNWATFTGYFGNGLDAASQPIQGTPRRTNSLTYATPTPTGIPSRVVINEVLIRPRHDWEGTGGVTTADEFIELYNPGPLDVYLKGWWLDDGFGTGSNPFDLPGVTIPAEGYAVFFRTQTKIALNDTGDTVRLLAPDQRVIDEISYLAVRAANLSFGRLPDGSDRLRYGLWPTPHRPNQVFKEPRSIPPAGPFFLRLCPGTAWPAGSNPLRASMERIGVTDTPASWATFAGPLGVGRDADGGSIWGTPSKPGSVVLTHEAVGERSEPLVLINEVAWAGTAATASDEWIELFNLGPAEADLRGWQLTDGDDLNLQLNGTIAAGGYFLLERTDDEAIANLPADQIYTGSLSDDGEILWLIRPDGQIGDSANAVRPGHPVSLLTRAVRAPAQVAWLRQLDLIHCGS